MFSCPDCAKWCLTGHDIFLHFKYVHSYSQSNFQEIVCPHINCLVSLSSWSGLLRHIKSHENVERVQVEPSEEGLQNNISFDIPDEEEISDISEDFMSRDRAVKLFQDLLINFCSSLMSRGVSNSIVDYVVKDLDYTFSQVFKIIIRLANFSEDFANFPVQVESLMLAFKKLRTSYSRQNLYEKNNKIVKPVEITLGTRIDLKLKDNKRKQVLVPETFMYVPILKTLEKIFSLNIYSKYLNCSEQSSSCYERFCDTQSFKNNALFKNFPRSIQIQLFYDDFETVNPLGSKRGIHKIGAFYFILRNFPDYVNSELNNIHLLALFHTEDAKKYGLNSILKHIIPDIKILETLGILVGNVRVLGTICCLIHDNLGGNTLLGFMESFSANYYCRICCTSRNEAQNIYDHKEMIIRNRDNYSEQLGTKSFGVTGSCDLNNLNYFHFIDSPVVDIMHDLLEGVVPYELKLVLQKLINLGSFTLEDINNRLMCHDYGYLESRNKPCPLRLDLVGNKIAQKAAQAWCLIRFLPVIIGDLIISEEQLKY